jgi:hypothetical protein
MEITPDRLIEIALDNLKRKLASAVSSDEPISPAALEKLPAAIREAVDTLRSRGIHGVRAGDILAEARADLASRLAGSLKAGVLLPNELSPEIVKWLAGTPLAIQITNMIQPSSRYQMAGGAAAGNATGPIAILSKPPEDNGPIGIITRPPGNNGPIYILSRQPGDQTGDNGPIGIITRPPADSGPIYIISRPPGGQSGDSGHIALSSAFFSPGGGPIGIVSRPPEDQSGNNGSINIIANPPREQSGDSGAINIVAKPPGDSGPIYILPKPPGDHPETATPIYIMARPPSEGSSGGSKKGRPRLWWLLPAGFVAGVILFLAGSLAISIGKGSRPAPTATHGLADGATGKTYTVTPSETSAPSFPETPTVTATCSSTPTDTLTATLSWTDTPTPTMPPAAFFEVTVEPKHIYYRGSSCGEKQALFQVKVAEPAKVAGVWLFVRLRDKNGDDATTWGEALVMSAAGSGEYSYLLFSEAIPDFTKFREAWVQYQFVAYDRSFAGISTSEVFWDLDLSACGK